MSSFETDRREPGGRRELVVPLVFLLLSGLLMVLPLGVQQRLSAVLRSSVLAPFVGVQESLHGARIRAREISDLQAQLDSVIAVILSQRTAIEENERLRELLDLRERAVPGFVPASAIRPGTRGSESMFLLDVGSEHGVALNDPVVVGSGLLGVVREVGQRTSLAMDWTHPDFRVSVMTLDGEAFGIVEPRQGAFREEDRLLLNPVPYHTQVELGIPVITSGEGSVYPRGILVGRIESIAETEAGWRRSYWLEPAVFPGSARHVLVLTGEASIDPTSLEHLWILPVEEADPSGANEAQGMAADETVEEREGVSDPGPDESPDRPEGGTP